MSWISGGRRLFWLGALMALSACAVDDSERVERAREYLDRGELRAAGIELKNVLRSDPANVDARTLLGVVTLEAGDAEAAAKELQKARELGADDGETVVPYAQALLQIGQLEPLLALDPAGLIDPGARADLLAVAGSAWLRKGDSDAASQSFERALQAQPEHPEALVGQARIKLEQGDSAGAEAALRRVIASEPELAAAHAVLGRLQLDEARYQDAQSSFEIAVAAAAGPAARRERLAYLGGLVDALLAQGESGRAQDTTTLMLDIAPEHPFALFQAARADFEAGDLDSVLSRTQQIIATYPDYQPARLMLAAAALTKENYALAEVHLRSLANTSPENSGIRKLLAQTRMNLGSPEDALDALRPLLDDNSSDARLLTMAGSASLRAGDRETGLDYLSRGLAAGSGDRAVQLQAASSLMDAGEPRRALEILEAMAPADAADDEYNMLIIRALIRNEQTGRARRLATEIVTERPDDPGAYRILGAFHMAVGEPDEARRQFEKGLESDPGNAVLLSRLTSLDIEQGRADAARARLERRLQAAPNDVNALGGLAHIAERDGNMDEAVRYLERARRANPGQLGPPLALSEHYLRQGQIDLALERAMQAREIAPQDGAALTALGHAQLEGGRHSEAQGTLQRALQYAPASVEANFQMARAQLKLGLDDAATETLRKTVELEPRHIGARVALARMEGLRGNYAAALATAATLVEQFPNRAEPYVLQGDLHTMRGHMNDAIASYDRAGELLDNATITVKRFDARRRAGRADSHRVLEAWLEDRPDDEATRVVLAQAYMQNGLTDKAIAEYERVLANDADNVVALNNLAWIYAESGGADNLARGVQMARRAREALPTSGAVADTYGWLLLQQGDIEQATSVLRGALREAPDNPDIRYHLAVALHRGGASQEARDLLDGLLSREGNFLSREDARELREQL